MKYLLLFALVACSAADKQIIVKGLDITGAVCSGAELVLQDPILGVICTTEAEIEKALKAFGLLGSMQGFVSTHDKMQAVIMYRGGK